MIAIFEKYEHNVDFHQIVDFVEASHIRRNLKLDDEEGISTLPDAELFENLALMGYNILPNQKFTFQKGFNEFSSNITTAVGEGSGTPTEPHHTPSHEAQQSPLHDSISSLHPITTTETIPTVTPTKIPTLRQYSRRARIAQSTALPTVADEPASPLGDDSQGEAFLIVSYLEAGQDRENIIKTSALPNDSTPRVTSLAADEGNGGGVEPSREDATIKEKSLETGEDTGVEKSTERGSNDTEELVNVFTSLDAANILTSRVQVVSVPPAAKVSNVGIPTGSGLVPTASPIFTTAILKSHSGWKTKHFKGMSLEEIRKKFIPVWKQIEDFVPIASKEEGERFKRKGLRLEQGSAKKMKTCKDVSEEDLKEMMQLVPMEEVYVEALQLWTLVKETLSIRQATSDKEKELWVELKRLFEPDVEDQLWTHTQALMHDPVEWKLYDTCGVHHVLTKDQEIFMLVEMDYPLRKGLAIVMISNKLQVENYSQMANDLILKIYNIANSPR
nr:hypothetical protein [Tanacetum cinerariifolium]